MNIDARLVACALAVGFLTPGLARGQEPVPSPVPVPSQEPAAAETPPTLDDTIEAGEALAKEPPRRLVKWNHYEGPYFTIRVGGGVLYEGAWYSQDEESRQQFDLEPEGKVRDARFVI
jgi:hypothetical protein